MEHCYLCYVVLHHFCTADTHSALLKLTSVAHLQCLFKLLYFNSIPWPIRDYAILLQIWKFHGEIKLYITRCLKFSPILIFKVSQGSATKALGWDRKYYMAFLWNLVLFPIAKEFSKKVEIWQSYGHKSSVSLFNHSVYNGRWIWSEAEMNLKEGNATLVKLFSWYFLCQTANIIL